MRTEISNTRLQHGGAVPPVDGDEAPALLCQSKRGWWQCKRCSRIFESWTDPPTGCACTGEEAGGTPTTQKQQVDVLFQLARLVRNTDGLFPSVWGDKAGKLLIKVKALDEERYQKEVMEK
jgi:hypothetical protein